MVGDARLERAAFGSGDQKQLFTPFYLTLPKPYNEKTEDLTPEQLTKLLEAIDEDIHPQAGAIMKMALFTGMRRGESFKLKWKHINFAKDFILLKDPKGGPDQKIPLNDAPSPIDHQRSKTLCFS